MKANESIWHALTAGIDRNAKKLKLWYEILPGALAYKAVTLGRTRKFLGSTQFLILYHDGEKCRINWILKSQLLERL